MVKKTKLENEKTTDSNFYTIGDVADRRSLTGLLEQHDQRNDQQPDDGPKGKVPEIRVH